MLGNGCGMVGYVLCLTVAEVRIGPAHHLLLERELEVLVIYNFEYLGE